MKFRDGLVQPSNNPVAETSRKGVGQRFRPSSQRLVALTSACNVTGLLMPIAEAIELADEFNALVLIDVAQTACWWNLDFTDYQASEIEQALKSNITRCVRK